MELELVADYQCSTGEGPLWHEDEKKLYWLDIPAGRMFRYDPAVDASEMVYEGESVGGATIQEDGRILLFGAAGSVRLWSEGIVGTLIESLPGEEASRFNDVIADPAGRVYCGTMPNPDGAGTLYRLDCDGAISPMFGDVLCSNGMGFTPDRQRVYFTDSMRNQIYLYDYCCDTGHWTNKRVFVDVNDQEGIPDGMTVDAEGCVWSARWDGGCLVRYDPDGQEMTRILFPAKKVSCAIFAGDDYDQLYVTTAGGQDRAENGPAAGALFRLDVGVKGVAEFRSRVDVGAL